MNPWIKVFCLAVIVAISPMTAFAAVLLPFTLNLSEVVNVDTTGGIPRIAVNVGSVTRYATYTAGTGTSSLVFTYNATIGDVDLDGVTLSSPIDLNGGNITDTVGNNATLTFTPPNTAGVRVNYPSLGMDFVADADGRYTLNGTVYNDLPSFLTTTGGTFTRGSIGTYYDSTGTLQTASANTPRFDHDPVTLQPKGILIEESRTNYARASDTIDNITYWNRVGVVAPIIFANAAIAPDGTMSAEEIDLSPSGDARLAQVNHIPAASNQNATTFSVWLKAKTAPGTVYLAGRRADTLIISGAANVTMSWQKFTLTIPASVGGFSGLVYIGHRGFGGTCLNYYAWGAQHEIGAFPTSYIPTTTAAATREADNLDIPISSWINNLDGTFFINAQKPFAQGVASRFYSLIGGLGQVSLINDPTGTNITGYVTDATGAAVIGLTGSGLSIGSVFKSALTYANNDFAQSTNGSAVTIDSSGTFSAFTNFTLGNNASGGPRPINTSILKFNYYPTRIPNPQLQLMTQ